VWLLGEPLTLRLMLALATVCIGIALVNRRVVPATPPTRTSETST
jgi:drug/metabolite transporter (DMT)-like permease